MGRGDFFPKKVFHEGENLWEYCSTWEDYWSDHAKREEFLKMHFPVIWTLQIWNIRLKIKPRPFYRTMEGFILGVYQCLVIWIYGSKVVSFYTGFWYSFWNVNTINRGSIWKIPFAHNAFGTGNIIKSASSFLILLFTFCTLMPWL